MFELALKTNRLGNIQEDHKLINVLRLYLKQGLNATTVGHHERKMLLEARNHDYPVLDDIYYLDLQKAVDIAFGKNKDPCQKEPASHHWSPLPSATAPRSSAPEQVQQEQSQPEPTQSQLSESAIRGYNQMAVWQRMGTDRELFEEQIQALFEQPMPKPLQEPPKPPAQQIQQNNIQLSRGSLAKPKARSPPRSQPTNFTNKRNAKAETKNNNNKPTFGTKQ